MHCIQNPNAYTDLACWVTNSFHPDGLDYTGASAGDEKVVATVTMERRTDLDNSVTYYVYAPDGRRLNAIALDSEGSKAVPEVCYTCHGGSHDDASKPTGGTFLPFDLHAFKPWQASGTTLSEQASQFALLNQLIYQDEYNGSRIRDAIQHWYGGVPTESSQFEDLPPDAWFTNPNGYNGTFEELNQYWHEYGLYTAYASNCRLCHVVEEPGRPLFAKGATFEALVKPYICGSLNFPPPQPPGCSRCNAVGSGNDHAQC